MGHTLQAGGNSNRLLALIVESADKQRDELFFSNPVVIGRADSCDITIQNGLVSRHHIEFFQTSQGWSLRDLDSTNGSFVNGERISEIELTDNGLVALGSLGPKIKWRLQSLDEAGNVTNSSTNDPPPSGSDETWLEESDK